MLRLIVIIMSILISSAAFSDTPLFKDGLKLYLKGEIENAVQIWKQLADEGDIQSQKQLGQFYLTDEKNRDYEQAINWYRKAATQGDKESINHLKNVLPIYDAWQKLAREIGSDPAYSTMIFREHLHEGDNTHCGFVIEVRSKVVLIQTDSKARWFKKDDVFMPDVKGCTF